jgi:hypothetical protein
MIPSARDPPSRSVPLWLAAAFVLCCFPIVARTAHPLGEQLFLPITPLDRTDGNRAKQWAFLESCRPYFPPASSITVLADDPDTAMSLYMMSIGAFPYSLPLPSSYYGLLTPEEGRKADFVLAYGRPPPAGWPLRLVANVENGAIYARVAAP